jgi:hypothetical protein
VIRGTSQALAVDAHDLGDAVVTRAALCAFRHRVAFRFESDQLTAHVIALHEQVGEDEA